MSSIKTTLLISFELTGGARNEIYREHFRREELHAGERRLPLGRSYHAYGEYRLFAVGASVCIAGPSE